MAMADVIKRARNEPPYAVPERVFSDQRLVCKVLDPIPWNKEETERALEMELPADLKTLWDLCGGLILYEDNLRRQWGLVVMSPPHPDFITLNREYREDEDERRLPGDLVFARFWGDRERPLIRNDKSASDYGTIMIAAEMDPRSYWDTAAQSLEEFLMGFMDAHGAKFWEYHYQKRLAEQAKASKG